MLTLIELNFWNLSHCLKETFRVVYVNFWPTENLQIANKFRNKSVI